MAFDRSACDPFDRDQVAGADDADAIGDALDFGQGVAREEDGRAVGDGFLHHALELPLDERVEA